MSKTIQKRIAGDKEQLLEKLKSMPVIQIACRQAGISRATFYRWKTSDKDFAQKADKALFEGVSFVNDMAESQIISGIKDRNLTASIFWLKNRHKAYSTRIEVSAANRYSEELTPEQEAVVTKALEIVKLLPKEIKEVEKK